MVIKSGEFGISIDPPSINQRYLFPFAPLLILSVVASPGHKIVLLLSAAITGLILMVIFMTCDTIEQEVLSGSVPLTVNL
ncbi:hypothetical protein D3C72_798030 [compost metagenome]